MQHWILIVLQILVSVVLAHHFLRDVQQTANSYEDEQKEIDRGGRNTSADSNNHNGEI